MSISFIDLSVNKNVLLWVQEKHVPREKVPQTQFVCVHSEQLHSVTQQGIQHLEASHLSSHGPVIQYCASLMAGTKRSVLHPLPKTQLRNSANKNGLDGVSQLGAQLKTARRLCCHLRGGTHSCALPCHVWPGKPPELLSVKFERGIPVRNLQMLGRALLCERQCGGSCSQSKPRKSSQSAQPGLWK